MANFPFRSMDTEVRCPNCGTTKYANTNLKMMVNVCGHSLCESCVEQMFVKGAAKCPTCNTVLKRTQFRIQLYDDENVEKELEIRKRLLKDLNMREEDFETLREYNDYLEMFETCVANLANGVDVLETNRRIEQFKTDNANKLARNKGRLSRDMQLIEQLLEEEQEAHLARTGQAMSEAPTTNRLQQAVSRQENLVDALLNSTLPAEMIVNSYKQKIVQEQKLQDKMESDMQKQVAAQLAARRQQTVTFSTGVQLTRNRGGGDSDDEPMDTTDSQGVQFTYQPPRWEAVGPPCPTPRTIVKNNYLVHVRPPREVELACGFKSIYPCQRALQEAILDLTFLSREL